MPQEIIEKEPEVGEVVPYPNYRVILFNDEHNTFEHVISCLEKYIPGMSADRAKNLALKAHNEGSAVIWTGPKEVAEMYYEQLRGEGLTITIEPEA